MAIVVESSSEAGSVQVKKALVNSYEDLRHHVVDTLPELFEQHGDGELRMAFEYQRGDGKWCKSKKSTPIDKLKDALGVRVRVVDAATTRRPHSSWRSGSRRARYGKVRVVNCSISGVDVDVCHL